ncbi:MAG: lysophospholipid acyltransferase family protein [Alphaproteobacteria bacterium]|nr:lysophospholipid acyltransferase family protein [Alphaproteobacteria bacterium]
MARRQSLIKRVGQNDRVQSVAAALIALYIRLVRFTGRWTVVNGAAAESLWAEGRPFILAFWHGRLLMMPTIWRKGVPFHMLISQHRDGQLIARTVRSFSLGVIAGSTRKARKRRAKGGQGALLAMTRALRSGASVGITPDGPRGPRMRASEGVVALARLAGVPIIPAACSARPSLILRTWDRFFVPLPFARGVFIWGQPMTLSPDADEAEIARFRAELEAALNAVTRQADSHVGGPQISPQTAEVLADA